MTDPEHGPEIPMSDEAVREHVRRHGSLPDAVCVAFGQPPKRDPLRLRVVERVVGTALVLTLSLLGVCAVLGAVKLLVWLWGV